MARTLADVSNLYFSLADGHSSTSRASNTPPPRSRTPGTTSSTAGSSSSNMPHQRPSGEAEAAHLAQTRTRREEAKGQGRNATVLLVMMTQTAPRARAARRRSGAQRSVRVRASLGPPPEERGQTVRVRAARTHGSAQSPVLLLLRRSARTSPLFPARARRSSSVSASYLRPYGSAFPCNRTRGFWVHGV